MQRKVGSLHSSSLALTWSVKTLKGRGDILGVLWPPTGAVGCKVWAPEAFYRAADQAERSGEMKGAESLVPLGHPDPESTGVRPENGDIEH